MTQIPYPLVPLGEVLQHRKEFITVEDSNVYKRCRVQLHAQGIVLRDSIQGFELKTKQQQVCKADEFLVAEIDAKLGGYGLVPSELDGSIVSSHYFLFSINHNKLDQDFLKYFIKTKYFADQISAKGTTNYAAIRPQHVLGYKIPLPPLEEQQRIVARIEELAAKIAEAQALRREAIKSAESLLENSSKYIFAQLETNATSFKPLSEVTKATGGGTPSKSNFSYWNGTIPWVSPKDMKTFEIYDSEDTITETALEESAANLVPVNSILLVVRSGILRRTIPIAINRVAVAINQDLKALSPCEGLSPEFLVWWLRANEKELLNNVKGGTTVQSIMWQSFSQFPVILVSLEEQERIVKYLDSLQAKIEAVKQLQAATQAELDALLPAVLDKAFKGELLAVS